jgi:putative DNA primase/helicase
MAKSKEKYNPTKALLANLPTPEGEADDYWEKNLEQNERQRIIASLRNVFLILTRDDRWAGVLGFDEFSNQVVKRKPPPFERGEAGPWGDIDDLRTVLWLSHHYSFNAEKKLVINAVVASAHEQRFHPVREYFEHLEWDREARLATWLARYCGASEDQYTQLAGAKFLIGAVARVMRPGCKMDNVLILEGDQGRWKSTALATLGGEWFGDTPFTIGDKDAYLVTRGHLIYELAELDGFTRTESSRAKAYFSSRYDTFVPKYVAWAIKVPRQTVFAGTVNHGTYLRDTTGNRRYWPVKIEKADIERLARDRDQLWAEALQAFKGGVRWWVEEAERELFALEQELRYVGDAYEDLVREWALGKDEFTLAGVLADCLHLEKSKWTRAEQTRVGEVLATLGFVKKDRGYTAKPPRYVYARRERQPGEEG